LFAEEAVVVVAAVEADVVENAALALILISSPSGPGRC